MNAATKSQGVQLDTGALLDRAREAAGLTDFGDEWFLAPLNEIVRLATAESRVRAQDSNPVQWLVGMLADRLKMVDYVKRNPKVHDEELDVVGAIIGLGRGGSTVLHRLMSASPQLTGVCTWEWMNPIPLPNEPPGDHSERVALGEAACKSMLEMWPEMVSKHPVAAKNYDEELQLLDRTLVTMMVPFYFYMPSYIPWLMEQDHTKPYEELRLWLKILQHQKNPDRAGRKWFLKTGHHVMCGHLESVAKAFPDAKLIMTHRRMESVLPSFCSMLNTMAHLDVIDFNTQDLGPQAMAWHAEAFKLMFAFRKTQPASLFIDVFYKDVVTDPQGQFRRIMEGMGLEVTSADAEAAHKWMSANTRDTHPPHKYAPEAFGVTTDQIAETFKFYHDAFIPQR